MNTRLQKKRKKRERYKQDMKKIGNDMPDNKIDKLKPSWKELNRVANSVGL